MLLHFATTMPRLPATILALFSIHHDISSGHKEIQEESRRVRSQGKSQIAASNTSHCTLLQQIVFKVMAVLITRIRAENTSDQSHRFVHQTAINVECGQREIHSAAVTQVMLKS